MSKWKNFPPNSKLTSLQLYKKLESNHQNFLKSFLVLKATISNNLVKNDVEKYELGILISLAHSYNCLEKLHCILKL